MYVKDFELISNIDILFESTIIIYGAGDYGKRTAYFLRDMSVPFDCFCDKNSDREAFGHPVISREELKKKTEVKKCLIIVASNDYCVEIIEELKEGRIDAFVCTWYGIQVGVELNIGDKRISKKFSKDYITRKEIWEKNFYKSARTSYFRKWMFLCEKPDAVWVYQPGKVGSTSLVKTLEHENIFALHIHHILHSMAHGKEPCEILEKDTSHTNVLLSILNKPLKIIVNVREPVGRAVSHFMQMFNKSFLIHCRDNNLTENACRWVKKVLEDDYLFTWWFDEELKALTGIDIYEYPFDKERGYAWIKKDGIEILLLKMEQMNENAEVIGSFVGRPDLELVSDNIGSKKKYRYIYEGLKHDLQLPTELIVKSYQNKRYQHFYTEEETKKFMRKWIRKE